MDLIWISCGPPIALQPNPASAARALLEGFTG
jgi:hypothetical protein